MDTKSRSSSIISEDSLDYNRKSLATDSANKVDTILVPFYEKDVLITVPKTRNKKGKNNRKDKFKGVTESSHSYLVNKERKSRKSSYLEIFRKQFVPITKPETVESENEIRSLTPECGDTERGSLNEPKSPDKEFYNTESYNEMYYEKIMNQEISQYLENTFEQAVQFTDEIRSKSPDDITNNFRSVSETSHQPRTRRATIEQIQNIQLGGLGPDIENIKPRLERARSLQRYSEKVRMENRLRIYRKAIAAENEKKAARDSARHRNVPKTEKKHDSSNSYLVNKLRKEKSPLAQRQNYSSDTQNKKKKEYNKDKNKGDENENLIKDENRNLNKDEPKTGKTDSEPKKKEVYKIKIKSSSKTKEIKGNEKTSPVQINFLLNIDGVRPSTALRALEEKHKMYQEKIKAFTMSNSDNS